MNSKYFIQTIRLAAVFAIAISSVTHVVGNPIDLDKLTPIPAPQSCESSNPKELAVICYTGQTDRIKNLHDSLQKEEIKRDLGITSLGLTDENRRLVVETKRSEGMFRTYEFVPTGISISASYKYPEKVKILSSEFRLGSSKDKNYSFIVKSTESDQEIQGLIRQYKLNFISGSILTGRGIRERILEIARDARVHHVYLSNKVQPASMTPMNE